MSHEPNTPRSGEERPVVVRVIDVYPYRLVAPGRGEALVLRRARGRLYQGQWRMVGGKIEAGETAWEAALREVREELGIEPRRFWALPSVNTFYDWEKDRVNVVPAFAAEIGSTVRLDDEHDAALWLPFDQARSRLRWSEQRRMLDLVEEILRAGGPVEELVIK